MRKADPRLALRYNALRAGSLGKAQLFRAAPEHERNPIIEMLAARPEAEY